MRVETERLYLYPISNDEKRCLIDKETDTEMKQEYTGPENVASQNALRRAGFVKNGVIGEN